MKHRREFWVAMAFLAPNLIGFLIFTMGPVIGSFVLSFTSWDLLTPPRFVGLANFSELLGAHRTPLGWEVNDARFWKYLGNTLFLMIGLPFNIAGALCLALILNKKIRFTYLYRLVFFLPSILAGVAIFYLWSWIYNPDYGLMNSALGWMGIDGPDWLTNYHWSKPALMIMGFWLAVGGTSMILYLAALQGISKELYEAAMIDGANKWQQFRVVTWPGVAPVTFFILTMGIIGGLQSGFEAAYIMTKGGPHGATTTIGYYIYINAYENFRMGYAATISWVLFIIILSVTMVNWRYGKQNITI